MGSLVTEIPHSEVTATLEVLDNERVTREHLKCLRANAGYARQVGELIRRLGGATADPALLHAAERFYLQCFDQKLNTSGLYVPPQPPVEDFGPSRLLVIAKGLTPVYGVCAKLFPCWRYTDDLDKAIITNDRDPANGTYAIWVRDTQEADDKWQNHSANQLAELKVTGQTLLERLIHELVYFTETRQHLDLVNITLCSGSRYVDGRVPNVRWRSDKLHVHWYFPSHARVHLRCREVVS